MFQIKCQFDAAVDRAAERRLRQITERVHRALADCLNEIATVWMKQVKRRMPVDTGDAKRQVHAVLASPASLIAAVGSDIDYVAHLEFGSPYVAGGQVIGWLPGDPLITEWVRKSMGAAGNHGGTHSEDELMPPFRGSFDTIRQFVMQRVRRIPNDIAAVVART
jgi:hypothetical protein